jgi:hypothetical protein
LTQKSNTKPSKTNKKRPPKETAVKLINKIPANYQIERNKNLEDFERASFVCKKLSIVCNRLSKTRNACRMLARLCRKHARLYRTSTVECRRCARLFRTSTKNCRRRGTAVERLQRTVEGIQGFVEHLQ